MGGFTKILYLLHTYEDIIIDAVEEKEAYKHPKKDYTIKLTLPATW